jgi:hypothetical protein
MCLQVQAHACQRKTRFTGFCLEIGLVTISPPRTGYWRNRSISLNNDSFRLPILQAIARATLAFLRVQVSPGTQSRFFIFL